MDSVIRQMLVNVYELEGVLLLAQERGEATPDTVFSIIKEKAEQLLKDASALGVAEVAAKEEPIKEYAVSEKDIEESDPVDNMQVPAEDAVPETEETVEEPEEPEEDLLEEVAEPEEVVETVESETESATVAAVVSTMEKIRLFQERENSIEEPQPFYYEADSDEDLNAEEAEELSEAEDAVEEDAEIIVEEETVAAEESEEEVVEMEEVSDDIVEEIEPVEEEEVIEESEAECVAAKDSNINIEDAYIRNKSKDLRSAFSINDTFRFRRELFGNSSADMSDAINLVIAMNSYEEAEDYFYGDLRWDSESDEVKEFMEIIRNHFL